MWGRVTRTKACSCRKNRPADQYILGLHRVEHQEVLVSAPVTIRQRLRVGLHLKQLPGNLAPLGVVQPWQLGQDFRFAHKESLRLCHKRRKGQLNLRTSAAPFIFRTPSGPPGWPGFERPKMRGYAIAYRRRYFTATVKSFGHGAVMVTVSPVMG